MRTLIRRPRFAVYAGLLLICFFHLVSYTNLSSNAHAGAYADALQYLEMSRHTFAQVFRPFAYRLLTPWIVHNVALIPGMRLDYAWMLITFVATYAALVCFFQLLLDTVKLSLFTSVTGTVLLAFTYYYTVFNFGDPWLVDPLNNLLYVLAVRFLLKRQLVAFTMVVVLGTVNKESVLFLAPLYPLLAWIRAGTWRDREVARGVIATGLAGVLYVAFSAWAQGRIGGNESYRAFSWEVIRFALNSRKNGEHLAVFGVFNFLWFVALYGLYRLRREFGMRHDLIVITGYLFFACLFARLFATDTERMFVMMAPAVLAVCATVFERFRREADRLWLGVLAFLYVVLNLRWTPDPWSVAVNLAALVVFGYLVERNSSALAQDHLGGRAPAR